MKTTIFFLFFSVTVTTIFSTNSKKIRELPHIISHEVKELRASNNISQTLLKALDDFEKITIRKTSREIFCRICDKVIDQIISYRKEGAHKKSVIEFLEKLCSVFTSWGPDACKGYIDIEIDTVLFIIDNKKDLTAKRVCSIQFQDKGCTDPHTNSWSIEIPPVEKQTWMYQSRDKLKTTHLKILHLTDFHYDPLYKSGTNAACGKPLCCQKSDGPPSNPDTAAGYWGDYHICDTPWHTITDFIHYLHTTHEKFDRVYFTGDIISHKFWDTSKMKNVAAIRDLLQLFKEAFKSTPFYPVLGNHEPHPTDFFSSEKVPSKLTTSWIFELVATEWGRRLPESCKLTIKKGGYYTVLARKRFRIIALNSNVCYINNLWLVYQDEDPYDQLKWLVEVLTQAERNGEKVHILSHIPPGETQCLQQWTHQFRRIVNRFAHIIAAQYNGHTHLDEFRLFFDSNNTQEAINVAFNGGSFTTFIGLNPNYRVYDVDPNDHIVLDYDHYTFNLTEANLTPGKSPEWFKLYSFKDAYGLDNTRLSSLTNLIKRMAHDKSLLQKYYRYQVRDSDKHMSKPCDKDCVEKLICSITSVEAADAIDCQLENNT